MPDVDDFSNLPVGELADDLEIRPSLDEDKEAKLRGLLERTNPKALMLGKGKIIAGASAKNKPIDVIATATGLTPAEVKPLADAVSVLPPDEQRQLGQMLTPGNVSVFDLDHHLQKLCNEIIAMNDLLDPESEHRIPLFGTRLQALKLAMTYMKEAEFMKKMQRDHEEEMTIFLEEIRLMDAATANRLFARLEERKNQKRILMGK